jgi:NitT/TauT family transport system substrate-binding protein
LFHNIGKTASKNIVRIVMAVLILVLTLSSSVLAVGCSKSSSDDNYTVQLGYYNCDHMVAACVAKDAGIFDELGLKVNVTGNGNVPESMAAAKMDVGYVGLEGIEIANSKGAPVFVAANNHGWGSYYLVVSNTITDPQQLVGAKMAIGSGTDQNDPYWCKMADSLGIPRDPTKYKDYDMDIANKYLALSTGQIDGYLTCDPWGSMAEYNNVGHIMAGATKETSGVCCVYAMSNKFATEHPALAKKMLLAHTRAIEYVYTHPAKAAQIFADNYQVPVEVAMMTIYNKTVKEGRSLTWAVDRKDFDYHFEEAKAMGLADYQEYESSDKYLDTTLLDQCGADDFSQFIKDKVDPVFPEGMTYEQWKAKAETVN